MIQGGMILDGVYEILQEIGRGGTGVIYLAYHRRLNKRVVIKKIKEHFVGQVNERAEVDILKNLHHMYLPQVYDFIMDGDSIYTVMDYIEGRDLQYYLDQNYTFPEETVKKWLLQLAQVLEYLHSQKPAILHSDIKPANIMITSLGNVCLIDFNISLDGETTKDVQGISPWYAAPEQYERAQHVMYGQEDHIVLDGRMDIYSLGAVFYRVMTGRLPSPVEDISTVVSYMDIPYSDGLKVILSRMIQSAPSRRYASAEKLRAALEDISKMDPVYRKYGYMQIGAVFCWVVCVIAGILCIYYGSWKNSLEKWQKAYQELYLASESQDEAAVIAEGTQILNSVTYRDYLGKHEDKKAEVLNIVGESYFRQEQYKDAASYYKEAWDLEEAQSRYCENYIIALIRDGQLEKAEQAVESQSGRKVLSQDKRELIMLEITWMNGSTEHAGEELAQCAVALTAAGNTETVADAYMLLADIYIKDEAYADAVTVLEDALQISEMRDVRRRLGEITYLAALKSRREVYRNAYLNKALENYEVLNRSGSPSYEDRLNLALVQRALGKYESSNSTLKEMLNSYSDDYIVPMWMCYNYLDLAREQGSYQDIMGNLEFRYEDCKHMYSSGGVKNEDMEQLIEIMDGLEE